MREIKFRGYGKFEKKWVYGYGLHQVIFEDGSSNTYLTAGIRKLITVYRESAGEYTGCKDTNGKEIYEGDIVETTRTLNHIVGKVVMIKGCWYIQDGKDSYYRLIPRFGVVENRVIGNVYENKSLLEEE
ncbi:MAG: YopX family protein [Clostridiales bacterium]|nr:YopX family protein [Clostridiales bacterium]